MTLSNSDIAEFFTTSAPVIASNDQLRDPQRDGHAAAVRYFAEGGTRAVERIPVGCGKSGLITLLPFGIARGRVLVIAPNLTINKQLVTAFDASTPKCFYRSFGVLNDFTSGPWITALDASANQSDLPGAHVVVTNIHQLARQGGRWLPTLPDDFFDLIINDEGHHAAATSWVEVFAKFPRAKIISLTATPFRADNQPVEGDPIFSYPIATAIKKGYITFITSINVAPTKLTFCYGDEGNTKEHSLEEVLRLRERTWFSKGIALSEPCNVSIVDASIQMMENLREGSQIKHQIIAAACSIDHARRVRALYQERGLTAAEIHSRMPQAERDRIRQRLENGELDVIVQVDMLGEGFDHKQLSVAAVFRPYRSLSPYIQFVGRVMRVNRPNTIGHPDNRAAIVSHVGLNIEKLWDDFKLIDEQDKILVEAWLNSTDTPPARTGSTSTTRVPVNARLRVEHEQILDQFLTEDYLDVPLEELPDRVIDALRAQGIDPDAAGLDRDILIALIDDRRSAGHPDTPVAQIVQPQAKRKARRILLAERTKSVAKRICDAVGLSLAGKKLIARGGISAKTDLDATIRLMNVAIDDHVGRPTGTRSDWTIEEINEAMDHLDDIGDKVEADIRTRIA
ncbi:DEAD/DEAH box helicase [Pseudonocardia sichuanensis]|uniref:Superfamily II DNA or RNA helicase n=1 Tax=Pseudonocardia kunmingensis TaxID=630975 RepID=A0A543D9K8_9PSEU|nr:DEAD/DEAH box helicase family protein [Pseudonocardia kunmingensis]TQM06000.1 superfamily II DNA or RNA helicase [Pseudonocardia kunmingensis]